MGTPLDVKPIADPPAPNSQTEHRKRLIQFWEIAPGSTVLEIGCGQGDCTVVLAEAVGPNGHVTAVDPAPLDYGAPFTLGQAQDEILEGPLGDRITFVQSDPIEYVKSKGTTYDVAVLSHSLWYFSSAAQVISTFQALSTRAKKICIAEYGMRASQIEQVPHLLSAITQGQLWSAVYTQAQQSSHYTPSDSATELTPDKQPKAAVPNHFVLNVRTPMAPAQYKTLLKEAGLSLIKVPQVGEGEGTAVEKETYITPDPSLEDGRWEVGICERLNLEAILRGRLNSTPQEGGGERNKTEAELMEMKLQNGAIISSRDAMLAQLKALKRGAKDVRTMDVWVAVTAVEGIEEFQE